MSPRTRKRHISTWRLALAALALQVSLPAAAQVAPAAREVTVLPLVYRGLVWPAGTLATPPLVYRGSPSTPATAVTTPPLVYRGPVGPATALATLALVYRGPVWPTAPVVTQPLTYGNARPLPKLDQPLPVRPLQPTAPSLLMTPPTRSK